MEFLGIHGLSGRLRTYLEPGPKPSLDDATPSSLRASRNVLFWPMGLSLPSNPAARASASMSATAIRSNQRSDFALSPSVEILDGVKRGSAGHTKRRPFGTYTCQLSQRLRRARDAICVGDVLCSVSTAQETFRRLFLSGIHRGLTISPANRWYREESMPSERIGGLLARKQSNANVPAGR
jgi:hypothetical protein